MVLSLAKRVVAESCPERLDPLLAGLYQTVFPAAAGSGGSTAAGVLERVDGVPESLPTGAFAHATLLPDREHLFRELPAEGTVAVFGVSEDLAASIRTAADPAALTLVDDWTSDEARRAVRERAGGPADAVRVNDADSLAVFDAFDDGALDWVYINSTHEYEDTLAELRASADKVADDGYIAGDDYNVFHGVIPAVHQFCAETEWRLAYLTMETHGRRSYALEKVVA
ncbi:class I SAM-dependent methyltransferase [Haloarcula salina]|uniref:class I SAM-dependent methyltransferase n=1 Tax=Haloarcula salina TaxID=1429914 RepID=UPI003C6F2552